MQKVTRGACTGLVNNLSQGSVLLIADSIGFRDYFMFGIKKKPNSLAELVCLFLLSSTSHVEMQLKRC